MFKAGGPNFECVCKVFYHSLHHCIELHVTRTRLEPSVSTHTRTRTHILGHGRTAYHQRAYVVRGGVLGARAGLLGQDRMWRPCGALAETTLPSTHLSSSVLNAITYSSWNPSSSVSSRDTKPLNAGCFCMRSSGIPPLRADTHTHTHTHTHIGSHIDRVTCSFNGCSAYGCLGPHTLTHGDA